MVHSFVRVPLPGDVHTEKEPFAYTQCVGTFGVRPMTGRGIYVEAKTKTNDDIDRREEKPRKRGIQEIKKRIPYYGEICWDYPHPSRSPRQLYLR